MSFFIKKQGKTYGPFELSKVQEAVSKGIFQGNDQISEDQTQWEPVSAILNCVKKPTLVLKPVNEEIEQGNVNYAPSSTNNGPSETMQCVQQNGSFYQGQNIPAGYYTSELSLWQYFVRSITTKYADCSGRARRKEYWGTCLFVFIFSILASIILGLCFYQKPIVLSACTFILSLIVFIPHFSLLMRRMHDLGMSGAVLGTFLIILSVINWVWKLLLTSNLIFACVLGVAQLILGIFILIFTCTSGQKGNNKYGPDPKIQQQQ